MKKLFSILMSVFLIMSCIYFPTSPVVKDAHAATPWGIDVSEHQGRIDWTQVKASGCSFAIIRCGFGQDQTSQDDDYWEYNSSECERLGIPYGVYLYSYAKSTSAAVGEANHVLRLISGKKLSYPVYYDMEESSQAALGKTALGNIATAFCNKIEAAGYSVGVYANTSWWNNYLTSSVFDNWYRWVAQYASSCQYQGRYEIWQYTDSRSVPGISGGVDANYQYASVSGSSGSIAETLETDKSTYAQGEDIYVTASTATADAWVAIYGANDTISSATSSYYWYWVNGSDTEYGHGGTWIRGQSYNIYDAICSHRSLNGSIISGYLPPGQYKVAILYGDYQVLQSKTITITNDAAPYMEVSKTSFAQGEDIKVKAYSTKSDAWVGIFPGDSPTYGTGSFIYYYYTDDHNDTYVSLQEVGEQNVDHAYKDLPAGTYTLTLFGDNGYSQIDATQTITITNDTSATDKTTYNVGDPIYVTASCSADNSWVGLYKAGETPGSGTPSMYWYYIKNSADGIDRSGQTIEITDDYYYNTDRGETIGAGNYTVYVFGDSGYTNIIKSINITVTEEIKETKREYKEPTCTEEGYLIITYSDGSTEKTTYKARGHQYTSVMTAQTCTTQGYTTYTCGVCKHTYKDNYVQPTGHMRGKNVPTCIATNCTACNAAMIAETDHTPGAAATCTTDQTCTECSAILDVAKGHTPGAAATCTSTQNCTVCKIVLANKTAHTPGAAATCTKDQICTVCSAVVAKATGHKLEAGTYCTDPYTCTVCGETSESGTEHSWVAATCTEPKTCRICGITEGEATGHNWKDATCTEAKVCRICKVTEGEPAGHTPVVDPGKEATCEEYGMTEGSHCSACQTVLEEQTVIPAKGHDWKAATCDMPQICMNCSVTKGAPTGHTWEIGDVKTEPTCTENGKRVDTCKNGCGTTHDVILPAIGHRYIGTVTEPTCHVDGYTTYVCHNQCGSSYIGNKVPARHNPGEATCTEMLKCTDCQAVLGGTAAHTPGAEATCTEMQRCTECNTILAGAKGHTPGEAATCTTAQTCTDCGAVIEAATGHTPGPEATCKSAQTCVDCHAELAAKVSHTPGAAATCTTPQRCTECNEVITAILGHTPGAPATCETPQSCTVCHAIIASATGHTLQTVPGYAGTCDKEGLSDGKVCVACGEVFATPTATSKATHNFETVITPATTESDGAIETKCSHCGKVTEFETIAKIAYVKLSYNDATYNGKKKMPNVNIIDSNDEAVNGDYYTVIRPAGRTKIGIYTYTITFKGNYAGTVTLDLTIRPKDPTIKAPTAAKNSITVKWKKGDSSASGYEIMAATDSNFTKNVKKADVKNIATTSKKLTGLKANKNYHVKIRTYKRVTIGGVEQKVYSEWSAVEEIVTTIKPAAPTIQKPGALKKAVQVKWKKVTKQSSGYEVMAATDKAFTKNVKKTFVTSNKTTSKKISGLKAKKTYYVKVRTYKNVKIDGKMVKVYSNWSKLKTVKTN